jgi:hypothetical protein
MSATIQSVITPMVNVIDTTITDAMPDIISDFTQVKKVTYLNGFEKEYTEKAKQVLETIASYDLKYLENHEVNKDALKIADELVKYENMSIRYSKGKLSDADMLPVFVGMAIIMEVLPKEFDTTGLSNEEIRMVRLNHSVQLFEFIKSCRVLTQLSISKEEYLALSEAERAEYSEIENVPYLINGITKVAPYIRTRLFVNYMKNNLDVMNAATQYMTDTASKIEVESDLPYKKRNPDIRPGSIITKLRCDDEENMEEPFLHVEIADSNGTCTYLLNIKLNVDNPKLTITEWSATTGGTIKEYNIFGSEEYEVFHGGSWLYQTVGSAFDGVSVIDRVSTESVAYSEHKDQFIQSCRITHQFMLGEHVQIEERPALKNKVLESAISFIGETASVCLVDKEQAFAAI